MKANELAKRVIDRIEHPETIAPIRWLVAPTDELLLIDGQPDDLLAATTPDGKVLCYCWRSYWEAL